MVSNYASRSYIYVIKLRNDIAIGDGNIFILGHFLLVISWVAFYQKVTPSSVRKVDINRLNYANDTFIINACLTPWVAEKNYLLTIQEFILRIADFIFINNSYHNCNYCIPYGACRTLINFEEVDWARLLDF